jgi:glutaminyl-peptide cyclotransferase
MRSLLIFITATITFACSGTANTQKPNNANVTKAPPLPVYGYEVVKSYPHDPTAFTQGLFFYNGSLYESTGQEGRSQVRKIDVETGKVTQKWDFPKDEFGEGSVALGDKIYVVTWQDRIGRVLDAKDLKVLSEFEYQGEGWGLATDGTNLIMSQGTHVLKVIDPNTFKQVRTIPIMREDGRPLMKINELEFVKGEIWANIWHSEDPNTLGKPNHIARIDPQSGKLTGWIDLAGISPDDQPRTNDPDDPKVENTLNGIAYDPATERIFVTGKQWKKLYEIRVTGPKNQ